MPSENGTRRLDGSRDGRHPVFAVLQLSGGNDFLNTVIPYADPLYFDYRKTVGIPDGQVLRLNDRLGLHPAMGPIKSLFDQGKVAVIPGVGYPEPDRSHFRSMDIWHTAEPARYISEGWLGRVIRELDPKKENVLTGVSFGSGLPRAMYLPGTPATSVSQLEGYGLMTSLAGARQRQALKAFTRMYMPVEFDEAAMILNHLGQTGRDALAAVDLLKVAPTTYESRIEYASDPLSQSLKGIAQIHLARLGTRIFYAEFGGFDVHGNEVATQAKLWGIVSRAINDFFADLQAHNAADDVVMLVFSEFGRRVRDNGNGTDHGSGGGAFLIGERVNGGVYAEYPSLEPSKQLNGDLRFNNDFRMLYTTILEEHFGMPAAPIVNGNFGRFDRLLKPLAAA
ncbi:MAG: DUF1501 domain-containing protein [Chloroflexi bacterium]|nr:DUF1501 domain-containing protein [Chloroflexota bacterium]